MESRDVFASSKQLEDISAVYMEAVYGKSAGQELADREKKDDAFGAPKKKMVVTNADKKANTPAYQKYKAGDKRYAAADHMKEEELHEKQKDTPDQVKAVIAYDKARKGTEDAVYDTEHGKKKQAKKEKDYAKWQRDKGAEDAQKSGHPWEHAKGSTREKEGKKSEKHAHIKDNYEPLHSTAIQGYADAYEAVYENWTTNEQKELVTKEVKALQKAATTGKGKDVAKADKIADEFVPSENVAKLAESGQFSVEELWKIIEVEEGYQREPDGGEAKERQRRREQKGGDRTEKVRGERTPMPPRGNKRREDFERWYAANVR